MDLGKQRQRINAIDRQIFFALAGFVGGLRPGFALRLPRVGLVPPTCPTEALPFDMHAVTAFLVGVQRLGRPVP